MAYVASETSSPTGLSPFSPLRAPQAPVPIAIGVDTKDWTERWRTRVVEGLPVGLRAARSSLANALAGGRFLTAYGVGSRWTIAALDSRSGKRQWKRLVVGSGPVKSLHASSRFVVVPRSRRLVILDAATGKIIRLPPK